jgi:hypothetical protein
MKKIFIISTVAILGLGACTHMPKATSDDDSKKGEAESTCNPGDEGYPKCPTGGGVSGPING